MEWMRAAYHSSGHCNLNRGVPWQGIHAAFRHEIVCVDSTFQNLKQDWDGWRNEGYAVHEEIGPVLRCDANVRGNYRALFVNGRRTFVILRLRA